jgi:twitching motility two-component system response regulator PilH
MSLVLIVDDVQTDRELIGRVVTNSGHRVVYATDGNDAIEKARELKPAMIFMDVVMPNLNGFNACRKMKQDPDIKNIPVILVTSKGAESDVFWGRKQGADDHLQKPFSPDALAAVLKRYV